MKKIYFACSIRGGREDAETYKFLVERIKKYAHVLSEVFADQNLTASGMNKPAGDIWSNDIKWIGQSDAVIAEVTNPSLGVGYEIAKAEKMKKPVLCLYKSKPDKKLSAMIHGSPMASVFEYQNIDSAEHAISSFIGELH